MMNGQKFPIAVLGAGSWGTALAILLARNNNNTILWGRDKEQLQCMAHSRSNEKYLPGYIFPDALSIEANLEKLIAKCRDILLVVPSHAFVPTLTMIKPYLQADSRICWASKGLEPETGLFLSNSVSRELGSERSMAILSGPTFAKELAQNLPTACTLAGNNSAFLDDLIQRFHNPRFRIYRTDDMIGVQLGGAVKNIIAVGAGMADGLGFGTNTVTALITRGLVELTRLGTALGAKQETLYGLAGLGDLILTSTDNQSRNRRFGLALGKGHSIEEAATEIGQVVEAVRNTKEVYALSQKLNIDMPIVHVIYQVLYEKLSPKQAAEQLLTRDLKLEGE